jgi:hypothetical protein
VELTRAREKREATEALAENNTRRSPGCWEDINN